MGTIHGGTNMRTVAGCKGTAKGKSNRGRKLQESWVVEEEYKGKRLESVEAGGSEDSGGAGGGTVKA